MPQFDFTTYSSQIFWFSICFALLYYFVGRIILPRIRNILKEREVTINTDLDSAKSLELQMAEIEAKTSELRNKATFEYQLKIDSATKASSAKREKLVEELKEKIEKITTKSQEDLKKFIIDSKPKSESAVQDLVRVIKEKIFG